MHDVLNVRAILVVFFFMQKTAYEMRISDWSSDVCSSDLLAAAKSKGRGLGLLGDLLTGAGMVTGVAGAAGVGPQNWGDITSWFSKSPKLVNTGLGNLQGVRLPGASGFAAM